MLLLQSTRQSFGHTYKTHCNTLQHTCNTLATREWRWWTHARVCVSFTRHTATHCNTLATHLHCTTRMMLISTHQSLGKLVTHNVTHCSTLQNAATLCNTLQHTEHTVTHEWRWWSNAGVLIGIRDDVKLAQLVRARNCQIPRSSFRFQQKLRKPTARIYMDLSYIDPQARVLNYCFK